MSFDARAGKSERELEDEREELARCKEQAIEVKRKARIREVAVHCLRANCNKGIKASKLLEAASAGKFFEEAERLWCRKVNLVR